MLRSLAIIKENSIISNPIRNLLLSLFVLFLITAIACAPATSSQSGLGNSSGQSTQDSDLPPSPTGLELMVRPGTTEVTATWNPADGATSYRVHWRPQGTGFSEGSELSVADPIAKIVVHDQGLWLFRVEACKDGACGRGSTTTTPVIINIPGHQALRIWFEYDQEVESSNIITAIHLDWDPLPGYYVVKHRLSNHDNWATSGVLSEVGYTISADAFEQFDQGGIPIIEAFFNCDENGEGCALLGSQPNNTIEQIVYIPESVSPTTAARSSNGLADEVGDPITNMLRPNSDFAVTNEIRDDGISYRCISRAAENRWEEATFGSTPDAIKRCTGSRILNQYVFDPKAVFPDGATCGERPTKSDRERHVFGETAQVCNAHPTLVPH